MADDRAAPTFIHGQMVDIGFQRTPALILGLRYFNSRRNRLIMLLNLLNVTLLTICVGTFVAFSAVLNQADQDFTERVQRLPIFTVFSGVGLDQFVQRQGWPLTVGPQKTARGFFFTPTSWAKTKSVMKVLGPTDKWSAAALGVNAKLSYLGIVEDPAVAGLAVPADYYEPGPLVLVPRTLQPNIVGDVLQWWTVPERKSCNAHEAPNRCEISLNQRIFQRLFDNPSSELFLGDQIVNKAEARGMSQKLKSAGFDNFEDEGFYALEALDDMKSQRAVMHIFVCLFMLVVSFSYISNLLVFYKDKEKDIQLLRQLHLGFGFVLRVLVYKNLLVGLSSMILGAILGVLLCQHLGSLAQALAGTNGIRAGYLFRAFDFAQIGAMVAGFILIFTLIPSWISYRGLYRAPY